jgi:hypothetical protein
MDADARYSGIPKLATSEEMAMDMSEAEWCHETLREGVSSFRVGRIGDLMVVQWPGLATLACERDGSSALLWPEPGAHPFSVEKLQRGCARAFATSLAGGLALHASAVALGSKAVAFIGPSGSGKSTAAAELCVHYGADLLADDIVILDDSRIPVEVTPTEEDHWLTTPSREALGIRSVSENCFGAKFPVRALRSSSAVISLAIVVVLRFDSSIGASLVRRLRGVSCARSLLEAILRFEMDDASVRRREVDQMLRLHDSAPAFELIRNPAQPGGVAEAVFRMLGQKWGTS